MIPSLSAQINYYHSNDLPIPAVVDRHRPVDVGVVVQEDEVVVVVVVDLVAVEEGEMVDVVLRVVVVADLVVAELEDLPAEHEGVGDLVVVVEAEEAVGEDFKRRRTRRT